MSPGFYPQIIQIFAEKPQLFSLLCAFAPWRGPRSFEHSAFVPFAYLVVPLVKTTKYPARPCAGTKRNLTADDADTRGCASAPRSYSSAAIRDIRGHPRHPRFFFVITQIDKLRATQRD